MILLHQFKENRLSEWIKIQIILATKNSYFKYDTDRVKIRKLRKVYHANTKQKKAGLAILLADKADFKMRKIFRG